MLETLLAPLLAFALTFGSTEARSKEVALAAAELSQERDVALYFPKLAKEDEPAARQKMAKLWIAFAFYESSFRLDVMGDNNTSCGLMQVKHKPGYPSCQEMKKSAKAAMRGGAMAMESGIAECGGLAKGLSAYASGTCNGARKLVEQRCRLIGGC